MVPKTNNLISDFFLLQPCLLLALIFFFESPQSLLWRGRRTRRVSLDRGNQAHFSDFASPQQLQQTCRLLSPHYCSPPGHAHLWTVCYEGAMNHQRASSAWIIKCDVQRVLLIAADEHIRIPADGTSAFDCMRGIIVEAHCVSHVEGCGEGL